MMSKEAYKQRLVNLRTQMEMEKVQKKKDNEQYARLIKGITAPASKESYKKMKVARAEAHDRRIEQLKREIERTKEIIKKMK